VSLPCASFFLRARPAEALQIVRSIIQEDVEPPRCSHRFRSEFSPLAIALRVMFFGIHEKAGFHDTRLLCANRRVCLPGALSFSTGTAPTSLLPTRSLATIDT
jgi:hypothetical protein